MGILAISHITFIVRDLDRMSEFLCQGLGAEQVYDSSQKNYSLSKERFYVLGETWIAAMEGESPSKRSYQHIAFQITKEELPVFESRLTKMGVEILPPRPRVVGEGMSLYFYDFDNHLFELHTGTLDERLQKYTNEF